MFDVLLHEPEIPPNTGNVMRLCANTGCRLHLIRPLGFELDDARLRRAGLDYGEWADVRVHEDLRQALDAVGRTTLFAFSARGERLLGDVRFPDDTALLFGSETRGLPDSVLQDLPPEQRVRLPMRPDSRSLNLSNAVAVAVFEAWRQQGYAHGV